MKLNLGCGRWKLPGYLNVDVQPEVQPDQVVDLERIPWPFPDGAAEEVVLTHVLEHLGEQKSTYLAILKELYRICAPGALVRITVPHPRHDTFLVDPTHVRPILPESLAMLSRAKNEEWKAKGIADTPLALFLGVDFETVEVQQVLDPLFECDVATGKMTREQVLGAARIYANVIKEVTVVLRAVKP